MLNSTQNGQDRRKEPLPPLQLDNKKSRPMESIEDGILPSLSRSSSPSFKPKKKRSRFLNFVLNSLLLVISCAVTLVVVFIVGELWIRSNELPADTGSIYSLRDDKLPRAVLKSGAHFMATGADVRINSLGFRGREYTWEKPPGARRIVALGDSFTFGAGAEEDVIFTTRLERELNAEGKEPLFEVLNLGVVDYNTDDELALLKELGVSLAPDLVLLFYVMNDIEIKSEYLSQTNHTQAVDRGLIDEGGVDRQYRDPLYWIVHGLRQHSHFLAYLAPRLAALGRNLGMNIPSSGTFYSTAYADDVEGWQRSKTALKEIRDLGKQHHFHFALVLFPLMTNLTDSYPCKRSHEVIAAFAEQESIPFLDLLPYYLGKKATALWVSPTDGHPNAEGHRIAADAVLYFMMNQHDWFRENSN
ncbi:MAG: SGNH/GDSL hydrolase family protein [Candidatus Omnitrophota bacterium]|jgi:lysophospholipase L1-like esterase|nr:MAG: SGNH/GDSL hydrolase family protein [Candidatus Omnitrophota bacterium]